ncbi:MAG: hypothetical protein GTN38_04125 [Candidatus Aenigmarchaeota archaeon]|nr:hypothetical protein [Candidatus Aenigmarchaeota archaeon]NIP40848.1 hypothetical protein [Candidatus Aenigmarchaeota archaeon]NIQ17962.1 hypothetical protein [Candidatus Aenigmarchaeota archaeon]NIS73551.1 hypothetical protein [Candidatus Aenigmarchaeota archaeon]
MLEYLLLFLIVLVIAYLMQEVVNFAFFLPSFFIRDKKFECLRCGKCCRKATPMTEEDMKLIEKHGHKRKDFVRGFGPFKTFKKKNGYCIFLGISDSKATCSIYPYRAKACRDFPFKKIFGFELKDWRCSSLKK